MLKGNEVFNHLVQVLLVLKPEELVLPVFN